VSNPLRRRPPTVCLTDRWHTLTRAEKDHWITVVAVEARAVAAETAAARAAAGPHWRTPLGGEPR
jgi:hypothetical protein